VAAEKEINMELTDHNDRLAQRALAAIPALELELIVACSTRNYGGNRKLELQGLRAMAAEHGASERLLCAAHGYLPALATPGNDSYVDVLNNQNAVGFIDQSDNALQAAWILCRLSAGRHGSGRVCMAIRHDPMQEAADDISRIIKCLRKNRENRGPLSKSISLAKSAAGLAKRLNITPKEKTA
jgi:hypothetical protein